MELKLQRFLQEFKKKQDEKVALNPEQKAKDDQLRKLQTEQKKMKERQIKTAILTHSTTRNGRVRGIFTCKIPEWDIVNDEKNEKEKDKEETPTTSRTEKEKEKEKETICFEALFIDFRSSIKLNIVIADITQVETVIIRDGKEIGGDDTATLDDNLDMKWQMVGNNAKVKLNNVRYGDYFEIPFELDFAADSIVKEREESRLRLTPVAESFIMNVDINLKDNQLLGGSSTTEELDSKKKLEHEKKIAMLPRTMTVLEHFEKMGVANQVVDYKFSELEWAWIARRMIECDGPKQINNPQWVGCIKSLFLTIQHIVNNVLKIQDRSKLKQMRVIEHEKELNEMKMNEVEVSPFKTGFMAITSEAIMMMVSEMLLFFYYAIDMDLTHETLEICKRICGCAKSFCISHSSPSSSRFKYHTEYSTLHFDFESMSSDDIIGYGPKPNKSVTDLLSFLHFPTSARNKSKSNTSSLMYPPHEQLKFLKQTILEDATTSLVVKSSKPDKSETSDHKKNVIVLTRQDIRAITIKYKGIMDTIEQKQYMAELEAKSKKTEQPQLSTDTMSSSTFEMVAEEFVQQDERETRGYSKRRQIISASAGATTVTTATSQQPFVFVPLQDTATSDTTSSQHTFDFGFNTNPNPTPSNSETNPFDFSSLSAAFPSPSANTTISPQDTSSSSEFSFGSSLHPFS